jgi:hypothetical protein
MTSAVTNLWRQFVQRRLWPVAILLVAALAAVPLALKKDPAPPAPAPAVPVSAPDASDELAAQPIVAPAEARITRRKVLGGAKNPFGVPKQATAPTSTAGGPVVSVQDTGGDDGSGTGGSSPSAGGGGSPPSAGLPAPTAPVPVEPTPEPTPAPKKYAMHELTVRFGGADEATRRSVKRLQPLPSAELPVLIYMGVVGDGKVAEFLVDQGVVPVGDGECTPSPEQCETIRLRAGETEFLDVTDEAGTVTGQYQLDLIKIHKGGTASPTRSTSGLAASKRRTRRSEARSVARRVAARLP